MNKHFYLLKISLQNIEPEIWRRVIVPASITLDRLHDVIQIVMGWQDSHLYRIAIGREEFMEKPEMLGGFDDFDAVTECGKVRLSDRVKKADTTFSYIYDFGDNWDHEITVEHNDCFSLLAPEQQDMEIAFEDSVTCLEGERACPPEDVGGVPGYLEFCEAMNNPGTEEFEDYSTWYEGLYQSGEPFDSEHFNIDVVNYMLGTYMRQSRDRLLPWAL